MKTIQILETTKPAEQIELKNGQRLALWPEYGPVALEDVLGDLVSYQTIDIARNLLAISTDDEHSGPISEIVARLRDDTDAMEKAIGKHLTRAGMSFEFVSLRGYSQGEWAEIVIYAPAETITEWAGVANDFKAWFRGDVFDLELQTLKTYTAQDGGILARWEHDQITGLVLISESYGRKGWEIDWETLARDNFGIEIERAQN